MIPENRETDTLKTECIKELQEYIRQEVNYESLNNKAVKEALIKRLSFKAIDWYLKRGLELQDTAAYNIAKDTVDNYINNQINKPSNDKRGLSRLGYIS